MQIIYIYNITFTYFHILQMMHDFWQANKMIMIKRIFQKILSFLIFGVFENFKT